MRQIRFQSGLPKFDRKEKRSADINALGLNTSCIRAAGRNFVDPEIKAGSVRFAVQEVEAVLANEERRLVNRIGYRSAGIVIQDPHFGSARTSQSDAGASRVAERKVDRLAGVFIKIVVDEQYANGLGGLPRVEGDFAERDFVIGFLTGMARRRLI